MSRRCLSRSFVLLDALGYPFLQLQFTGQTRFKAQNVAGKIFPSSESRSGGQGGSIKCDLPCTLGQKTKKVWILCLAHIGRQIWLDTLKLTFHQFFVLEFLPAFAGGKIYGHWKFYFSILHWFSWNCNLSKQPNMQLFCPNLCSTHVGDGSRQFRINQTQL